MLRKLGSYGAFLQALSLITLFVMWMVIYPAEGFNESMMSNYSAMLSFMLGHTALLKLQFIVDLAFGAGLGVMSLALYRRFRARNIDVALLILGSGIAGSVLFMIAGGIGLVGTDPIVQLANGEVTGAFLAFAQVQAGVEMTAVFAAGWAMFFVAWAAMQAKAWKNWLNACGFIGGLSSILSLPMYLVDPNLAYAMFMPQILTMVFVGGIGFSLSGRAAEQAFELDLGTAR